MRGATRGSRPRRRQAATFVAMVLAVAAAALAAGPTEPAARSAGPGAARLTALTADSQARAAAPATALPRSTVLPGTHCPMFPSDNVWNTPIANLPVDPHSSMWLASMSSGSINLHPDYGPSGDPSNPYGIPYVVVSPQHAFVHLTFQYADESDPGPYPFGPDTPIEGGQNSSGDRHALMVDPQTCTLYELYAAYYSSSGSTAGSGAIWSLNSNALRPAGWTSADAAGLPILPGLVNYDEVASGAMDHAIRFTADCTDTAFIWPARHQAGQNDASCPPMGARFRLKASFNLPSSECASMCQTVLTTMKTYGLILADNGSNWYFQGTADTRWTFDEVDQLKQIPASEFVAVDESSLMVDPNSGQARSSSIVAAAPTPDGRGYYLASANGTVTTSGDARFFGDASTQHLRAPIVAMAVDPATGGYWLLGGDGGVFSFHAPFFGSTGGRHLRAPAVGLVANLAGTGYRFVASDGGVFDFGRGVQFHGSEGGKHLNAPIVGIAACQPRGGYWLVASDGGIFAFDAPFYGSTGGRHLNATIVQMEALASGRGYRFVAADGGIFDFGGARYLGSLGGQHLTSPVVGMAAAPSGAGYWIVQASGRVSAFGIT